MTRAGTTALIWRPCQIQQPDERVVLSLKSATIETYRSATLATLRWEHTPALARRLVEHPTWVLERVRAARSRQSVPDRAIDLRRYREFLADERQAVVGGLSATPDAYLAAKRAFWAPGQDGSEADAHWADSYETLQSLVSTVVRLLRPRVMVETGVARGYTSAVALAAMRDVGCGHLYSVDLPAFDLEARAAVGEVVAADLRSAWTLEQGPSRQVLRKLLPRVGPIDVFLHDSDHSYRNQLFEYRLAWPHLRPGGVLLSDDVDNEAFTDFAAEVRGRPYLVGREDQPAATGMMVKGS